jgi:hypothetical protein
MGDMTERRRHERVPVRYHEVEVQDQSNGEVIGVLANVSEAGMMLTAARAFPAGSSYQLTLVWHDDDKELRCEVGVTSLWSSSSESQALYWTGFQVIDISAEGQALLNQLLSQELVD